MYPVIYDGSAKAPAERVSLRAGALSLIYEAGMLRYIRLGDREILRGIYAAVRDQNWGTIPGYLHAVHIESQAASFNIAFACEHQQGDIHFVWRGAISGTDDGTIRFSFNGEALSSFNRNRVGFCILHPGSLAGTACEIEHVDGRSEHGAFPLMIAPNQPYFDIRAITHEVRRGFHAEVRMEGDTFEMEDQRNWTDYSFKTYCTPLAMPFPVLLEAGTQIQQAVSLKLIGQVQRDAFSNRSVPALHVDFTKSAPLPRIGLGVTSHGQPLIAREIERLKALNLAHLRLDLYPWDNLETDLRLPSTEANALECALEIAVHLGENLDRDLQRLRYVIETLKPPIARLLIFAKGGQAKQRQAAKAARHILGEYGIPLGGGTSSFFTRLNRERPPTDLLDWVSYSVNPQVHAFDNASLVETLTTQASTVISARTFAGNARIAVGPVTLKMRSNPDAASPEQALPPDLLPRNVDVRQMSLFGAVWTLGSIKWLAQAGADSLTYYETTGWLGVIEREAGAPLPEKFPSVAGSVYPLYHVFADVGEFASGETFKVVSDNSLQFEGLGLRLGDKTRLMLANFTPEKQQITIKGINGQFQCKRLDETTVDEAIRQPEVYRAQAGEMVNAGDEGLQIDILPYGLVRLDQRMNS